MIYSIARRLLVSGDVEYVRRAAWVSVDPDAALTWAGVGPGQGYIQFVSSSAVLYQFGPWSGRQEDLDADDWEVVEHGDPLRAGLS